MCLTTVTPSFVIRGYSLPFSIATFLPIGPRVIAAILAISIAVYVMTWEHWFPKMSFLAEKANLMVLSIER